MSPVDPDMLLSLLQLADRANKAHSCRAVSNKKRNLPQRRRGAEKK